MREQLESRLLELKAELEKGQQTLQELEAQAATVRQTLLRIEGAALVLEEILGDVEHPNGHGPDLSVKETAEETGPAPAER